MAAANPTLVWSLHPLRLRILVITQVDRFVDLDNALDSTLTLSAPYPPLPALKKITPLGIIQEHNGGIHFSQSN